MALLEVDQLRTHFRSHGGVNRSVDGVSFDIEAGETVAIVGESGCGKSVTAMSIMRLIGGAHGKSDGEVRFRGRNLLRCSEREMRGIRGNDISMIFQDPMSCLNPVLTIGRQLTETLRVHQGLSKTVARDRALDMLRRVRLAEPERRIRQYPHELSGGMRQRVMIAMALACEPALLIADEPTTALDVTVQAQVLDLLRKLAHETRAAIMLITHDLGVVAEMAERVVVMYAGRVVEEAPVAQLFRTPRHPYTRALLRSMPRLSVEHEAERETEAGAVPQAPIASNGNARARLAEIPGVVPALNTAITGCLFAPRCDKVQAQCRTAYPPMTQIAPGQRLACWLAQEHAE